MTYNSLEGVDYPKLAQLFNSHADYRVQQRFQGPAYTPYEIPDNRRLRALIVDCETTGLEPTDKIIEIGMISVDFDRETDRIGYVSKGVSGFEDPDEPIPPEITKITGIADADVVNQRFDDGTVEQAASMANIVIAHNAGFDRKFLEARFPVFEKAYWGCSLVDIPWADLGFSMAKQEYVAMMLGTFYDAHRALVDCEVLIHILNYEWEGKTFLSRLLENAHQPVQRVWARGAPFELKDKLKARGYKWSPGQNGMPKSWYRDVQSKDFDAERKWLRENIMPQPPYFVTADGYLRFSQRMDELGWGQQAQVIQ